MSDSEQSDEERAARKRKKARERLAAFTSKLAESVPHSRDMGHEIIRVEGGTAWMRQPVRDFTVGDAEYNLIHTSVQISLVDAAFGIAVFSALGKLATIATLDLRMDYLRPARADRELIARAECFHKTRTIAFVRGELWQDDESRPVSTAQGAFMLGSGRKPFLPLEEEPTA